MQNLTANPNPVCHISISVFYLYIINLTCLGLGFPRHVNFHHLSKGAFRSADPLARRRVRIHGQSRSFRCRTATRCCRLSATPAAAQFSDSQILICSDSIIVLWYYNYKRTGLGRSRPGKSYFNGLCLPYLLTILTIWEFPYGPRGVWNSGMVSFITKHWKTELQYLQLLPLKNTS